MMAGEKIFVYMGGSQFVPYDTERARIHHSVTAVAAGAFRNRRQLISVEFHARIELIEEDAFRGCPLKGCLFLEGVTIVKKHAFSGCAFTIIKLPAVTRILWGAFCKCHELQDVQFGSGLETIEGFALFDCPKLKRVSLPLLSIPDGVFTCSSELARIDVAGGIQQTVASLHNDSWSKDMNHEINQINQLLTTRGRFDKQYVVQNWMRNVMIKLNQYKAKHLEQLREASTVLELALWKANLDDNGGGKLACKVVQTRGGRKKARMDTRVTAGADIVIKNVLSFLQLA